MTFPNSALSVHDYNEAVRYGRGVVVASAAIEKVFFFFSFLIDTFVSKFTIQNPDDVDRVKWMEQVDQVDVLYSDGEGTFFSQKKQLTRFAKDRIKIYKLYRQGINLKRKYEVISPKSADIRAIVSRVDNLKKIIVSNVGSYVGTEGKVAPFVIYMHGEPKAGKTVLTDHLFRDVYAVMNESEYKPALDKYAYNSLSNYFDTYNYQRVFEVQDFLQLQNRDVALNEVVNIMRMSDESAYALNIAECTSKGTVFFASDYVYITSNRSMESLNGVLSSLITAPEAFTRRIDLSVHLARQETDTFTLDAYRFHVNGHAEMNYNQFVAFVVAMSRTKQMRSSETVNVSNTESAQRVADIQQELSMVSSASTTYPTRCIECFETVQCPDCVRRSESNFSPLTTWWNGHSLVSKAEFDRAKKPQFSCGVSSCAACRRLEFQHLGILNGMWKCYDNHRLMVQDSTAHRCSVETCPIYRRVEAQSDHNSDVTLQDGISNTEQVPGIPQFASFSSTSHSLSQESLDEVRRRWELLPQDDFMDLEYRLIADRVLGMDVLQTKLGSGSLIDHLQQSALSTKTTIIASVNGTYHIFGAYKYVVRVTVTDNAIGLDFGKKGITMMERMWQTQARLKTFVTSMIPAWTVSLGWKTWALSFLSPSLAAATALNDFLTKLAKFIGNCVIVVGGILVGLAIWNTRSRVFAEGIGNISGGNYTVSNTKKNMKRVMGPSSRGRTVNGETCDEQFRDLVSNIRGALGKIKTRTGTMHCIALQDHVVVFPYHAIIDIDDQITVSFSFMQWPIQFRLGDLERTWLCEENHAIVADLSCFLDMKMVRAFPRLLRKLVK
jgi:hypothetical protein